MALSEQDTVLFIVGMHRSGTSALCAALAACGASFGDNLLAPMAGVNDEGFWEDAEVVALNEALLASVDSAWYAPSARAVSGDWPAAAMDEFAGQAAVVLRRGFGGGALQVVKDPRFCLTLPLWLAASAAQGIKARVCTALRPPLEVANSLLRRDGFPLGYSLRLDVMYRQALARELPSPELQVSYRELATAPVRVMQQLAESLPLSINPVVLEDAVREDLRHHDSAANPGGLLATAVIAPDALPDLQAEIEQQYPVATVLSELATALVARGKKLTELGEAHSDALATISERDAQIREFDRRLATIGSQHSQALEVIARRDREIEDIHKLPLIGPTVRLLRRLHAQR